MNPYNNRTDTVTISSREYNDLLEDKRRYLELYVSTLQPTPKPTPFLHRLRAANIQRAELWNNGNNDKTVTELLFRSNELCGEVGEAANFIKKLARTMLNMKGGADFDTAKIAIAKELADVIICSDRVAEFLDIDLERAVVQKFNETSDKHKFPVKL